MSFTYCVHCPCTYVYVTSVIKVPRELYNFYMKFHSDVYRLYSSVIHACLIFFSPYFERIFSETPCKHPVIVLKDLRGWEIQAIVDFMYRGEISVGQEQLTSLIKAAESLQVCIYRFT